jgi:uncharacterized protein (DUF983 family)
MSTLSFTRTRRDLHCRRCGCVTVHDRNLCVTGWQCMRCLDTRPASHDTGPWWLVTFLVSVLVFGRVVYMIWQTQSGL